MQFSNSVLQYFNITIKTQHLLPERTITTIIKSFIVIAQLKKPRATVVIKKVNIQLEILIQCNKT